MQWCRNNNTTRQRCITRDVKYVTSANGMYLERDLRECTFTNSDGVSTVDDIQRQNKVDAMIFY